MYMNQCNDHFGKVILLYFIQLALIKSVKMYKPMSYLDLKLTWNNHTSFPDHTES